MPTGHVAQTTTDPKGNITTKVYDRAGRLWQVRCGADTTTYSYFDNGNLQSIAYPNGVTTHYTYYANNWLHTVAEGVGSRTGAPLAGYISRF